MTTSRRPAPDRTFIAIASLAAVGLVMDVIMLTGSSAPTTLVALKYSLAITIALGVLAASRAIRRAEAACLEDLRDGP